jgi:hypothetical protein
MATPGSGSGGASSSAAKSGSAQAKVTMPAHRHQAPAGCGKGIDYTGAAAPVPDELPHIQHLLNTPKAWISNGEMIILRWPAHASLLNAFPQPGATDCLVDLKDELAVQGADVTMRSERKRKPTDLSSFHTLRIVGPPGTVVQIYRRMRAVAGRCLNSFVGLPPASRPRVFAINEHGWDYDNKGYMNKPQNVTCMDGNADPVDEAASYSDDEYTELQSQTEDYRQTMQLTSQAVVCSGLDVKADVSSVADGRRSELHEPSS